MALDGNPLGAHAAAALLAHWRAGRATSSAYDALADAIRMLVIDGRIALGTRLPAERGLAGALGLSRTTVASAYATLRDDGFLESLRGSGSVVRLPRALGGRHDPDALGTPVDETDLLDLRRAALHAASGVADAVDRAIRHLPAALADHGYDTVGDAGLRRVVAERYAARGLPTDADQIVITLGAQHAIALLARTLVARGDGVLVESPTYPHAHEAFRSAGGRLLPVPVDAHDGWDVSALTSVLRRSRPAVAYLMPDLHNPTGATMTPDTRRTLLREAAAAGTVVIADETMGELRLDGDVEPPLAALGPAVLIGSADKMFWGGLRIGWIRAERALLQRLVIARPVGDLGTPVLEQLIVRELVPSTASTLDERRRHLREGRDHLVFELRARFPDWAVPSPAGGLTLWVNLGRPVSGALVLAARDEGLVLTSGGAFGPAGGFERFLRIPFSSGRAGRERIVDGLERAWMRVGAFEPAGAVTSAAVV